MHYESLRSDAQSLEEITPLNIVVNKFLAVFLIENLQLLERFLVYLLSIKCLVIVLPEVIGQVSFYFVAFYTVVLC